MRPSHLLLWTAFLTGCGLSDLSGLISTPKPRLETTLVAAPARVIPEATAVFEFSSNRSGVAYRVRLDGKSIGTHPKDLVLEDLADGLHGLSVRAGRPRPAFTHRPPLARPGPLGRQDH